MTDVRLLL